MLEYAAGAGISSISCGNFTWHLLYSAYLPNLNSREGKKSFDAGYDLECDSLMSTIKYYLMLFLQIVSKYLLCLKDCQGEFYLGNILNSSLFVLFLKYFIDKVRMESNLN